MDQRRRALSRGATVGVPLAFLAFFFAYPLASILQLGLRSGEVGSALDVIVNPRTLEVAWFTLWQAALSTVLSVAVALPASWAVGRFEFPGRRTVLGLLVVPFVLPTLVVALAFTALLPTALEGSVTAILAAHVFFNVAVVVRIVGTFWAQLDPSPADAAATLGAGPWRRIRTVTAPMLAPALAAASAIVFLFCLTSFGIVLVLGGPRYSTLETEIYSEAVRSFDLQAAAVLSLVQLAAVVGVVAVSTRLEARLAEAGDLVPENEVLKRPRSVGERTRVAVAVGSLGLVLCVPLAVLVERSLATGGGHSLEAFRALAEPTPALLATPWEAVVNSLVYATCATALALVVGGLAAVAVAGLRGYRLLDGLVMLPLGASAVMLGFGFVITFDAAPFDFRASFWLVPVAQALVAIPFVVRLVAPALRGIDERQREAAAALGASPARVRREIDLPVARRALSTAAGFAFAIALGEFGATVFLARPDRPTLPVAIYRFLSRPGELNTARAYALGVVLMAVTAVAVLLVERVRDPRATF